MEGRTWSWTAGERVERRTRSWTAGKGETSGEKVKWSDDMMAMAMGLPLLLESSTILLPTTLTPLKPTLGDATFSSTFYEARAKVLQEEWPKVKSALEEYGISCELNLDMRSVTFTTTSRRIGGADIIHKARDLLCLLALTPVPPSMAIQILDGRLQYDIIWTGNLCSQSKEQYVTRMKNVQRNLKGLAAACGCSIFFNGISVTAISKFSEGLLLVRRVVTASIVKGQNPGTAVRLINLCLEKNGETDNLEMDAYGFETAPGVKLKRLDWNRQTNQNRSVGCRGETEAILTKVDAAGTLKPSVGNSGVGNKESGQLGDGSTPEVLQEKYVFGPSVNKYGALVCGSFFFEHGEQAIVEAWPKLKSVLEDYGLSCTMYQDERFMTVSTTSRTEDPDIIYKAKDVLKLLYLSVPPSMVLKVLNGNMLYDIIETGDFNGGFCSEYKIDRDLYRTRRRRLVRHLKELAHLSGCSLFDDGHAVTAVGYKPQGLKLIRIIVKRSLVNNVRPATMIRKVKLRLERSKKMDCVKMP